MKIKKIK